MCSEKVKKAHGSDEFLVSVGTHGDIASSEFGQYGGLVFELFYRADLSTFS